MYLHIKWEKDFYKNIIFIRFYLSRHNHIYLFTYLLNYIFRYIIVQCNCSRHFLHTISKTQFPENDKKHEYSVQKSRLSYIKGLMQNILFRFTFETKPEAIHKFQYSYVYCPYYQKLTGTSLCSFLYLLQPFTGFYIVATHTVSFSVYFQRFHPNSSLFTAHLFPFSHHNSLFDLPPFPFLLQSFFEPFATILEEQLNNLHYQTHYFKRVGIPFTKSDTALWHIPFAPWICIIRSTSAINASAFSARPPFIVPVTFISRLIES